MVAAAFDFDFEDHNFHHFFFFLGIAGERSSVVGVKGVVAVTVPALFRRLLRTRRGGGPAYASQGSSFGGAFGGALGEALGDALGGNLRGGVSGVHTRL